MALVVAPLLAGTSAAAQTVGLGIGFGSVPRVFEADCRGNQSGQVLGASADVRASVPLGRGFSVETRHGGYATLDFQTCALVWTPGDGMVTRRHYRGGQGSWSSDVRLRFQPTTPLVLAAGGGWMWTAHAPYIAVSPGLRLGHRLRFLAELDYVAGHFPYDVGTYEFQSGAVISFSPGPGGRAWRSLLTLRTGIEIGVR